MTKRLEILTVNHHTAYLYSLSKTGHNFYVLDGWDESNRPVPLNCHLISYKHVSEIICDVDVVIGHHFGADVKALVGECRRTRKPYIQVIHGRMARTGNTKSKIKRGAKRVYALTVLKMLERSRMARFVFISSYDKSDWPMNGVVIEQGISVDEMYEYEGSKASLLVVGNALQREHFNFRTLVRLKEKMPVKIAGQNSGIDESRPARDWDELRSLYSEYRAFINLTREPEKGYNLATLEAMATGMPVISVDHPFTPIKDGWNGYLVKNFDELIEKSKLLLSDLELAKRLGQNAKQTVIEQYHIDVFVDKWNKTLIECTQRESTERRDRAQTAEHLPR